MNPFLRIVLNVFFFLLIFTGPVARGFDYGSLWFYLVTLIGLTGLIVMDRQARNKAKKKARE